MGFEIKTPSLYFSTSRVFGDVSLFQETRLGGRLRLIFCSVQQLIALFSI